MDKEEKFIDWNDTKIPIKERRKAFSDWLISKGEDEQEARRQAIRKFSIIDWNDKSYPIGKRKQAFVKYLMTKDVSNHTARIMANKKFGF